MKLEFAVKMRAKTLPCEMYHKIIKPKKKLDHKNIQPTLDIQSHLLRLNISTQKKDT